MDFISPEEYLCFTGGIHGGLDIAFVQIPVGASHEDCISYLDRTICEILPDSSNAMQLVDVLGGYFPRVGRLVVSTHRDFWPIFSLGGIVYGQPFAEGDLLLCCRLSSYRVRHVFPKDPFVGKCKLVDIKGYL